MKAYAKNNCFQVMKRLLWILVLANLLPLYGQETQSDDVKVGLVLSGGGAKGFAHIGALKVIEEAGIRIDYIGGTSMGAIIGALYASGYSARQLDSIFKQVEFDKLIQDQLPRNVKTFYERDDQERYALTLPFTGFKVKFPSAISRGQNVYNLLSRLLQHVSHVDDFNELPIPFFCVATDIETGEAIVLNDGYLPEAISASGAFPSLFEPVELDGRLLIDGGVVNNYPIDEVRAMGADIIVGVDVQDALAKKETLTSATNILLQINNYRTVNDMKQKSGKTDVYIKPDISAFTVISFEEGEQIIKSGEEGALQKWDDLVALASKQKKSLPRSKPAFAKADSLLIKKITMQGNKDYTRAYIKGKLRLKLNERISYEKFDKGINNLSATNNFDAIRYKLTPFEDGEHLEMNLRENTSTTFLKMGVHYDDLYKSAALINVTKKRLFFNDDVASLDVILGDNVRYNFEYYIDKGFYWSIGVNSRFNGFEKSLDFRLIQREAGLPDTEVNRINVEVSDFTNQIYAQTVIRQQFAFGMGLEHKHLRYESETISEGSGPAVFEDSDIYSAFGFLRLDTYDDRYFPKKGFFMDGDFHLYLYSTDFPGNFDQFSIGKAKFGVATTPFRKVALNLSTEGGFTIGGTEYNSLDFLLGGYGNDLINNFIPFYGYDFISFGGDSYVKATATIDYEFIRKNHLNFSANFANAQDDLFKDGEWFTAPDYTGYAIGYSLETLLGPVEIKYTWSPENRARWFFNVGFWF